MRRSLTVLGILATAGFLFLGTPGALAESRQAQPQADIDVDGMDHSKLNHGVLGHVAFSIHDCAQVIGAQATDLGSDPDVAGMDHSKLNHGVLGHVAVKADEREQIGADQRVDFDANPDAGADHSRLNHGVLGVKSADAGGVGDPVEAALDIAPESRIPPLSAWAPPAEIAGKVRLSQGGAAAGIELAWRPPMEVAQGEAAQR